MMMKTQSKAKLITSEKIDSFNKSMKSGYITYRSVSIVPLKFKLLMYFKDQLTSNSFICNLRIVSLWLKKACGSLI